MPERRSSDDRHRDALTSVFGDIKGVVHPAARQCGDVSSRSWSLVCAREFRVGQQYYSAWSLACGQIIRPV